MFISGVADGGAVPALVKTLAFNEARLKIIADNVANAMTPGYRAKQLDVGAFQKSLAKALEVRRVDPSQSLAIRSGTEVSTDGRGNMKITPTERPAENILFHDGTNLSLEREMADLAETGMTHEMVTSILAERYQGLRRVIRGGR